MVLVLFMFVFVLMLIFVFVSMETRWSCTYLMEACLHVNIRQPFQHLATALTSCSSSYSKTNTTTSVNTNVNTPTTTNTCACVLHAPEGCSTASTNTRHRCACNLPAASARPQHGVSAARTRPTQGARVLSWPQHGAPPLAAQRAQDTPRSSIARGTSALPLPVSGARSCGRRGYAALV